MIQMETVEVLVRIPKREFEELQGNYVWWGKHGEYIKKGTVLPKGYDRLIDVKVWEEIKDEITRKARSGQWSEAVVFGMMRAYDIMCKHLEKQEETNGKIGNDN